MALTAPQLAARRLRLLRASHHPARRARADPLAAQGYRTLLNIQHLSPSLGDTSARGRHARVASSSGAGADATVAFTTHIAYDGAADASGGPVASYEMVSMTGSSRVLHGEP
jgi:hypothetical protein